MAFLLFCSPSTTPGDNCPGALLLGRSKFVHFLWDNFVRLTFIEYIFNGLMTLYYEIPSTPNSKSSNLTANFMEIFNWNKVLKYICLQAFNCSGTDTSCGTQVFVFTLQVNLWLNVGVLCLCSICNRGLADHMVALFLNTLFFTTQFKSI